MTSTIKVNTITTESGSTLTIGGCGKTVALASGASQTGFGRSGSVDWQTTPKTTTFTAVNGEGYFVDTSSGAVTANLPAGTAGAIVAFADYTRTFGTNALTVVPNGSNKIGGIAADAKLTTDGQAATFVFVDATEGWINVQNVEDSETGATFITATGGTITNSGNCKIHTFTGPGTFCVSAASAQPVNNEVSYIVVAGGGGGGYDVGGGGGAGGFREHKSPTTPYTASPIEGAATVTVSATGFPITVGAGGVGATAPSRTGGNGNPSVFSTITSTAGGGGGGWPNLDGSNGGSGGGGGGHSATTCGGLGNTPPVSPSQGSNGGNNGISASCATGGGGGGATAVGANAICSPNAQVPGGAGATTSITGSPVTYAAGGKGSEDGAPTVNAGGANTGDGADGAGNSPLGNNGAAGGSGVVIIRYRFQ